MNNTALEITILQKVPKDDNEDQTIEVKATVNWDHIKMIVPRLEGGSTIVFAFEPNVTIGETRKELTEQINGLIEPKENITHIKKKGGKK